MKRAVVAVSLFAAACLPGLAWADDDTPSTLPPLPPPPAPATPPARTAPAPARAAGPGAHDTTSDADPDAAGEAPDAAQAGAPPDAANASPEADATHEAARESPRPHGYWSIEGAYARQQLYGVRIDSGEIMGAGGVTFPSWAIGGFVGGSYGATVDGLTVLTVDYGVLGEYVLGILRLGIGARLGVLYASRVTASSDPFLTFDGGALARVAVDVATFESTSLFVVGKATVDAMGASEAPLYGLTLGFGLRFRPHRRDEPAK